MTRTVSQPSRRDWLCLAVLAAGQFIISIDYNIVYVALPQMAHALNLQGGSDQWVVTTYALAFGGLLLIGGRLCDMLGARQTQLLGLALFAIGSIAGATAQTIGLLLLGRGLQGAGAAILFPSVLALLGATFTDPTRRAWAYGIWGTVGGAGLVIGSLAGGFLTASFGWPAVFLVNVPLAALTAMGTIAAFRRAAHRPLNWATLGVPSAIAATLSATSLTYGLTALGQHATWPMLASAFVLAVLSISVFIGLERRTKSPLIPSHLRHNADLIRASLITAGYMAGISPFMYATIALLQGVHGLSPAQAGLALLPLTLGIAAGSSLAGRPEPSHHPHRTLAIAAGTAALGLAALAASCVAAWPLAPQLALTAVIGVGQGGGWTTMFALASQATQAQDQGTAAGVVSTTQQIGGALGLAAAILAAGLFPPGALSVAALAAVAGAMLLIPLALAALPSRRSADVTA